MEFCKQFDTDFPHWFSSYVFFFVILTFTPMKQGITMFPCNIFFQYTWETGLESTNSIA
jgi:hypothetical protein